MLCAWQVDKPSSKGLQGHVRTLEKLLRYLSAKLRLTGSSMSMLTSSSGFSLPWLSLRMPQHRGDKDATLQSIML